MKADFRAKVGGDRRVDSTKAPGNTGGFWPWLVNGTGYYRTRPGRRASAAACPTPRPVLRGPPNDLSRPCRHPPCPRRHRGPRRRRRGCPHRHRPHAGSVRLASSWRPGRSPRRVLGLSRPFSPVSAAAVYDGIRMIAMRVQARPSTVIGETSQFLRSDISTREG